jgi:hypothetical protein
MSANETKPVSDQRDERRPAPPEPTPAKVHNDGSPAENDEGHQTGGGHDGMEPGPTGS